ncbi:MAG: DNA recombination protein RmuC [Treponema sp.]|jgi:DNA recombination protein RmuC|nr:DNA recombination protein RmuC [Treponema sp.]
MNLIIEIIILIVLVFHSILLIMLFAARRKQGRPVLEKLDTFETRLGENERTQGDALRGEFGKNREEISKGARESREELTAVFTSFTGMLDGKLRGITDSVAESARGSREELAMSLKSFEDRFAVNVGQFNDVQKEKFTELITNQNALTHDTHDIFNRIRDSIEQKLLDIQNDNSVKLEKMRETVDEKLHQTLETRLGESFKIVSDRLELVQKGLGEMQTLATGVGDLKKVLTNVKTKGVLGEYQLEGILEQLLTIDQYGKNVKTKQGSNDIVEFAVKIPAKDDSAKVIWLPIDSKFPTEDYERLNAAYDAGSSDDIDRHKKELERKIKTFAKDIKTKYVDPPHTTDFAIMFLPFEGLYAEVLRIPNLFRSVQDEFKITITGPTTVSAFLSSLQMGFRSLAVEKRTSEIWELLGAVRTEFGKFGDVLEKTKEKLESASKEIDKAGVRSRAIEKHLRNVQSLPGAEAHKLLGDATSTSPNDELF